MKKIFYFFSWGLVLLVAACDLQPRIMSLPDSVGDFISARYPALLADPETQPEIYNSAATDYGVYASPELYGSVGSDEYVMYASVDDYIIPPQSDNALYGATEQTETNASPDVAHGAPITNQDTEFVMNAASDDYLHVPIYGGTMTTRGTMEITVVRGDTLYSLAQKYKTDSDEIARLNNLSAPFALHVGQKLRVPYTDEQVIGTPIVVPPRGVATQKATAGAKTETRVKLKTITVAPNDTLYSLSRKYSVPVNDLAVMNNLAAPFNLSVGQKLKVPNLDTVPVAPRVSIASSVANTTGGASAPVKGDAKASKNANVEKTVGKSKTGAKVAAPKQKISSDPTKKLPKINARSSSKFSWPVRGKILSHYGAKSGGLFNDGINIAAARGTAVGAAENGVVAYAGNEVKGMGNLIIIQHSDGWMTVYAHMDSMTVRRGTRVSVGQKIGTVGATGKVEKPQLHFEIRKGTKAYNPSSYLKK